MLFSDQLFVVVIVIFSAVIHEVMHGYTADLLGDKTARYAGRLTLNPIPHIDLFGSILMPLLLVMSNSPIFLAWAKPVPYNPYNLKPWRWSEALVAFAGPFSNIALATICAFLIRAGAFGVDVSGLLFLVILTNVTLFLFNLIPIPPLDGSKVVSALLPYSMARDYNRFRTRLETNPLLSILLVFMAIILLGDAFGNAVYGISQLLAG